MIADYVYAQDNQSTLARMYGAALTTGSTVERRAGAAGAAARRHRRAGARCRAALSRQAPFGDRLSGQGRARARRKNREQASQLGRRGGDFAFSREPGARRQQDRGDRQPGRDQGLAGARAVGADGRARLCVHRRRQCRSGRQAGRRQHGLARCSTKAPAISMRARSRSAWRRRRSSSASRPARDQFRGSLRSLSANLDEAVTLLRLALTVPRFDAEPVERIRSQMLAESEPRQHQSERDRQPALVGDGVSRIIPMAGPRTARRNRSPPSRSTISRPTCATCSRATADHRHRRRHRVPRPPAS